MRINQKANRERIYMLKLKYLFENFELAKSALENWEHDEDSIDDYLCRFRISSNAVYPFPQKGKCCFLRLSPVEEKLESNLSGELEFLEYLKNEGYPAMRVIPSKSGETLLRLDTRWGGYYASAFEGVAGICVEDTDYSEEIMFSYGKQLALLHKLSTKFYPVIRKQSYEDVLTWIHGTFDDYNAAEFMYVELENVTKELSLLEKSKDNFGLVHYDFEPDNVFYDNAAQCCNVIDFEDGMYHFYLVDLEQALDSIREEAEDKSERAISDFLKGYESERPLESGYEQKLPLMRRFCNLYAYARLIRSVEEKLPEEPDWMSELREKLTQKIRYIENTVSAE